MVNEIIKGPIRHNNPNPYCLFQYYSPIRNTFRDFRIELQFFYMTDLKTKVFDINKLTSHCKWTPGAAFRSINPLVVNNRIIDFGYILYKLGYHTTVCHCSPSSRYNCSVDQLGTVYPGENLTVDLCLPSNKE